MGLRFLELPVIALALMLAACGAPPVQTTFAPAYPERNASGDTILANFEGRIPCARTGCDKLKVSLVLYQHPTTHAPTTYWLGVVPGVPGAVREVRTGIWRAVPGVAGHDGATAYVLDEGADEAVRYWWRVNEDILLALDGQMRPKAGNAAWGNMLSRDTHPYGPRTYVYDAKEGRFTGATIGR